MVGRMPAASQTIEILEDSLSEVQHALGTAQHVLHVADATERTVRRARLSLRRGLIVVLVAAIIGLLVFALRTRAERSADLVVDESTLGPEPADNDAL